MKGKTHCDICKKELEGFVMTSPDGKKTAHVMCFMEEKFPQLKSMTVSERLKFMENISTND